MKRNITGRIALGCVSVATLLAAGACTDDHFDIRPASETSAKTLWQNIESTPELSKFADLLQRVKVLRTDKDNNATITFAQLLNEPQTYTVFAPINENFDTAAVWVEINKIAEQRALAATLEGAEKTAAINEANRMEYVLGNQFAKNHIARFNFESVRDAQVIRMLNGKNATYNAAGANFNGIDLVSGVPAVPSSNGTMHLLSAQSPFLPNLFDYMEIESNNLTKLYAILDDPSVDKEEFKPESSVPGAMDENGNMVYVDSIYLNTNSILDYCGAQIKNEDSLYVALIPTDNTWDATIEKLKKYYNFGTSYRHQFDNNVSVNNFNKPFKGEVKFTQHEVDSLIADAASSHLISSMFFSPGRFAGMNSDEERTNIDLIEQYVTSTGAYAGQVDSLISTNGTIFFNPNKGGANPWFQGVEAKKVSNGIVYPMDNYTIDPANSLQSKIEINLAYGNAVGNTAYVMPSAGVVNTLVQGDNWDAYSEDNPKGVKGTVPDNRYRFFNCQSPESAAEMKIQIPLNGVLSAKYRVIAEILPNRVNTEHKWTDKYLDQEGNDSIVEKTDQLIRFQANIYDDNGTAIKGLNTSQIFTVDSMSVQRMVLFEEVDFPKCYYGLPSQIEGSFPTLVLSMKQKSGKDVLRPEKGREYGLSISRIILEPIPEQTEE